jgi:hypothetical protein
VTDDDVRVLAIAAGSKRDPIVGRRARDSSTGGLAGFRKHAFVQRLMVRQGRQWGAARLVWWTRYVERVVDVEAMVASRVRAAGRGAEP